LGWVGVHVWGEHKLKMEANEVQVLKRVKAANPGEGNHTASEGQSLQPPRSACVPILLAPGLPRSQAATRPARAAPWPIAVAHSCPPPGRPACRPRVPGRPRAPSPTIAPPRPAPAEAAARASPAWPCGMGCCSVRGRFASSLGASSETTCCTQQHPAVSSQVGKNESGAFRQDEWRGR